jgi:hypothetical protein
MKCCNLLFGTHTHTHTHLKLGDSWVSKEAATHLKYRTALPRASITCVHVNMPEKARKRARARASERERERERERKKEREREVVGGGMAAFALFLQGILLYLGRTKLFFSSDACR